MVHLTVSRLALLAALPGAAVLLLAAGSAHAQQPGMPNVAGVVVDSATGSPVANAEVVLRGARAITDARGEFRLSVGRTADDTLRVRRLGFRSRAVPLPALETATGLRLPLAVIARQLSPVVVEARWDGYTGRLAGYYQRLERRAIGQFITREDLDAERTGLLTNVLQRMPGIQVRRGPGAPTLTMRGRNCTPLVWLDGVAMPAGHVDLDSFSPSSLHGVELYLGAMSAPLRFQALRGQSECGTIVLWSRGPDTDPVGGSGGDPADLERQLAMEQVFTADQVDRAAVVHGEPIVVPYPQALKSANVTGTVTVEFIVDAEGRVEAGSIGIVTATDPRFVPHVAGALQDARYAPAVRGGRAVRQLVRQRFSFGGG